MRPLIIVQARTGSTRLPQKMIYPFYKDKSVLEILLERLKISLKNEGVEIVVATTDNPQDDAIVNICNNLQVKTFRGSETDVLKRFIDTAEKYGAEKIIRICADNIFLDTNTLKVLISYLDEYDYDYVSYVKNDGTPSICTHYGFFCEGVKLEALKHVDDSTTEKLYHEHVTNRIYTASDIYSVKLFPIEDVIHGLESHVNLRLTLDTKEDLEIQKIIFEYLQSNNLEITPENILNYLDNKNSDLYNQMAKIIKENSK